MTTMIVAYTKEELILILSYLRAKRVITSQAYRSINGGGIGDLGRFLININMI